MIKIEESLEEGHVTGFYQPKYESVVHAFMNNFKKQGEVGACLCATIDGEVIFDLWGGMASQENPWQEHTITSVFSCTKAATAICAHLLVDRGELDLEKPISHYWPEFSRQGKKDITVKMALNHTAALPALRDPIKPGGFNDWEYMIERLQDETPFWKPGTGNGYHLVTFGWLVGEVVRRISGLTLGQYFKTEIADPLSSDFWIGLPEVLEDRVARVIPWQPTPDTPVSDFTKSLLASKQSIPFLALKNTGNWQANSREAHAAEIGGGGGLSNARGLAQLFLPFANHGQSKTGSFISDYTIERMSTVSVETKQDFTLCLPTRFALGFMKRMDNRSGTPGNQDSVLFGENAFGHVGMGGSIGFADPDHKLSFGYAMNKMGQSILLNERGQGLVDAVYACLR